MGLVGVFPPDFEVLGLVCVYAEKGTENPNLVLSLDDDPFSGIFNTVLGAVL